MSVIALYFVPLDFEFIALCFKSALLYLAFVALLAGTEINCTQFALAQCQPFEPMVSQKTPSANDFADFCT